MNKLFTGALFLCERHKKIYSCVEKVPSKLFFSTGTQMTTTNIEKEYVHQVYENIAFHFSQTRYKPWPLVEKFLNEIPSGSLVADVGCGNGKYMGCNENAFFIGSDRYETMVIGNIQVALSRVLFLNVQKFQPHCDMRAEGIRKSRC
jgi:hypothetical protein